jgi:alkanesulfonate monooxygenase SsuD/methylene tetrahydromethanopterin reductase-like flavin-dependent oxidoreductase (luciferase family)
LTRADHASAGARPTHPWVAEGERRVRFGVVGGPLSDWGGLLGWVRQVEALGFDSFWLGDHTLLFPIDCWTALTALATNTRRVRLGSLVSCVYYRPPALLARVAADVDRLSGGRLVLGLGVGDWPEEFRQLGLAYPPLSERQEALVEAIEIVLGLWGEVPFTYDGKHFRVEGARVRPGPRQEPRVPLLIAGGGERVTLGQVAAYADMSNFGPTELTGNAWSRDDVRRKLEALRRHCRDRARPYESVLRSHFSSGLLLAPTAGALRSKLEALPAESALYRAARFAGTPDEAIAYFLVSVRGGDAETLRLLAERVVPALASGR